jgi:hypothetical protein
MQGTFGLISKIGTFYEIINFEETLENERKKSKGGIILTGIPNQDLCDLQIVGKIMGTKGWLLMFFTTESLNYLTIQPNII